MPRSGNGTLLRVDLKLEAPFDEAGQALHDPPAGLFAAHVDVTVIRVTHEPVAATLKLAIQFIQHEFESNGESGPPCGVPSRLSSNNPFSSTPAVRIAPDEPEQPPVRDARRHRGHQPVVIDPVEEFGQVNIHNEPIAFDDVGLRLRHRLVSGAARPEAVAMLAECRVPQRLEPQQDRLLDHTINDGWNAEIARPAVRLRDLHPTHRLRLVAPLQ